MTVSAETFDAALAAVQGEADVHFSDGEAAEVEVRTSLPFHPFRAMRALDRRLEEFAAAERAQRRALALLED